MRFVGNQNFVSITVNNFHQVLKSFPSILDDVTRFHRTVMTKKRLNTLDFD